MNLVTSLDNYKYTVLELTRIWVNMKLSFFVLFNLQCSINNLSTECFKFCLFPWQKREVCNIKHFMFVSLAIHKWFSFLIGPNDVH